MHTRNFLISGNSASRYEKCLRTKHSTYKKNRHVFSPLNKWKIFPYVIPVYEIFTLQFKFNTNLFVNITLVRQYITRDIQYGAEDSKIQIRFIL